MEKSIDELMIKSVYWNFVVDRIGTVTTLAKNMDQFLPSAYYHIFNHANGDEYLFREPEN